MEASLVDEETVKRLVSQRDELRAKIAIDSKQLKKLERIILSCTDSQLEPNKWTVRALGCLNHRKMVMKTSEILECLYWKNMQELDEPLRRRNFIAALSTALNKMCDNGTLSKKKVTGEKGDFYGLSEWFDSKGNIKKQYERKKEIA